jgi:hypothetical protein
VSFQLKALVTEYSLLIVSFLEHSVTFLQICRMRYRRLVIQFPRYGKVESLISSYLFLPIWPLMCSRSRAVVSRSAQQRSRNLVVSSEFLDQTERRICQEARGNWNVATEG